MVRTWINRLALSAAYKLTLDKKRVENYYYNDLTEPEPFNIEVINYGVNKRILVLPQKLLKN
jgi:hypothetical protein